MRQVLLAASLLLTSSSVFAEVRFVLDEAYPPYMTKSDGEPAGILTDIVRAAAARMDTNDHLRLDALPWPRAVKLTEVGRAQGLVGAYYQPEARPWIQAYSEPLLIEQVGIYCRKGVASPDWSYPTDYKGLIFGNNSSFETPGHQFFTMVDAGDITLEEALTTEQNLMKVDLGRVDCYVQERLVAEKVIRDSQLDNVDFISIASEERSMVAYPKAWEGPGAKAFIKAFDAAIVEMKQDGTIEKIIAGHTAN
ncbi:ABC transporter substrate-binding protein [Labrenzia sp. PHM005]|uniref:substrate-binding periplasmic protein n=1 Tax=Labrenzia sp. PHM005 TaxID=2590016 RepID=UPI001AD8DB50|nr:transporter substrate-binding domain-containing protein [Labrenzia sp. PHM005]